MILDMGDIFESWIFFFAIYFSGKVSHLLNLRNFRRVFGA